MTNVDILIRTREDGSIEVVNLGKNFDKTGDTASKSAKKTTKEWDKVQKKSKGWASSAKKLASSWLGVSAVIATVVLGIGNVVSAASEMEDFEQRLISLTKSEEKAAAKLKVLTDFAARTPFQLNKIVEAGVQAEAFGLSIEKNIEQVGDLAAFMGTDIVEASSAMGRAFAAGAGAADLLRDRGVLNLVKDFARLKLGITDMSKLTLPKFRKVLVAAIGDPNGKIAGAADRLAKTVSGMASMFGDATIKLATNIGNFLEPLTKFVLERSTALVGFLADMTAGSEELKDGLGGVKDEFNDIADQAKLTVEQIQTSLENLGLIPKETLAEQAKKELDAFSDLVRDNVLSSNEDRIKGQQALFENLAKISEAGGKRILGLEQGLFGTGPLVKRFDKATGTLSLSYRKLGNQLVNDSEDIGKMMAEGLIKAPDGVVKTIGNTTKVTLKNVSLTVNEFLANTLKLAGERFPILEELTQKHLSALEETELKITAVTIEENRKRIVSYEDFYAITLKGAFDWKESIIKAQTEAFEAAKPPFQGFPVSIPPINDQPLSLPNQSNNGTVSTFTNLENGIDFVPRNMPANLHKGERVVTAEDNRRFDNRRMGDININTQSAGQSPQQLAKAVSRVLHREAMRSF